jgi:hypothetical protein
VVVGAGGLPLAATALTVAEQTVHSIATHSVSSLHPPPLTHTHTHTHTHTLKKPESVDDSLLTPIHRSDRHGSQWQADLKLGSCDQPGLEAWMDFLAVADPTTAEGAAHHCHKLPHTQRPPCSLPPPTHPQVTVIRTMAS